MPIFTRKDVYDAVWSKPLSHLSADYGVSSSYLKRLCVRHEIPVPQVGYWNLPDARRSRIERPKLPPSKSGQERVAIGPPSGFTYHPTPEERATYEQIKKATAPLSMPERVNRWHKLLEAERASAASEIDRRKLRVLNFVFAELERRHFTIGKDDPGWWAATHNAGAIVFRIREALKQVTHHHPKPALPKHPTSYEQLTHDLWREKSTTLEPTGELVLEISGWGAIVARHWRDAPGKPLEQVVGRVIAGFEDSRTRQIERSAREQDEARLKAERLARAEARRRQAELEARRWEAFTQLMNDWHTARTVRAFIATIEERGVPSDLVVDGLRLTELLDWVKARIDRIDPLTRHHIREDDQADKDDG